MIDELLTAFQGAGGEAIEVASGSQTRDDDVLFAAKAKDVYKRQPRQDRAGDSAYHQ